MAQMQAIALRRMTTYAGELEVKLHKASWLASLYRALFGVTLGILITVVWVYL